MDSYEAGLPSLQNIKSDVNPVEYQSLRSRRQKRGPTIHSMKSMYCSLSVCSILVALIGLSYLLFDPIVKYVILGRLVLRNESDFADLWKNPPITPHFKVYFFNLTNPEDFFSGKAVPNLQEVGPYTYHQKWIKENVSWHENGTMTYSTRKEFKFIRELSAGDQSLDNITTIDVPLISAYAQMGGYNYYSKAAADWMVFESLDKKAWVRKTPEELIWGYPETLFALAKTYLPDAPPMDNFGFFTKKNQTENLASYTMYTGRDNPYNLSKISLFNGKNSLGIWSEENSKTCNKVQGSDGATFNPYIQKDETLWFFNDQLCRSLPLVFDKSVKSKGEMPGYRFVPREDVFKMDFKKYPENQCFCDDEELCKIIGDGMFAVPKCQFKAPIVLSWPHFLHANETFRKHHVTGLEPADPEKHGFWFDVQPITGTTLSAKARVQINIAVRKDEAFTKIANVKDSTIVPLLWFEEGIEELGDELLDVIGEAVTQPPMYKKYILFMLLGVSMTTVCVVLVTLTRFCMNLRAESQINRHNKKMDSKKIRNLIQGSGAPSQAKNQLANFKRGHAHNPSQGSGKFLLESEDSSRHHSRNSSTGSNIPTSNIVVNVESETTLAGFEPTPADHKAVQNGVASTLAEAERLLQTGVALNLPEEAERLLQNSDQRLSE